jgi:hypothetical protein
MLKVLNPWLRDNFLTNTNGKTYVIKIPATGFRTFAKKLNKEDVDSIVTQSEEVVQ